MARAVSRHTLPGSSAATARLASASIRSGPSGQIAARSMDQRGGERSRAVDGCRLERHGVQEVRPPLGLGGLPGERGDPSLHNGQRWVLVGGRRPKRGEPALQGGRLTTLVDRQGQGGDTLDAAFPLRCVQQVLDGEAGRPVRLVPVGRPQVQLRRSGVARPGGARSAGTPGTAGGSGTTRAAGRAAPGTGLTPRSRAAVPGSRTAQALHRTEAHAAARGLPSGGGTVASARAVGRTTRGRDSRRRSDRSPETLGASPGVSLAIIAARKTPTGQPSVRVTTEAIASSVVVTSAVAKICAALTSSRARSRARISTASPEALSRGR